MFPQMLWTTVWASRSTGARLLWIVLLCLADRKGNVDACDGALAHYCRISREEFDLAVAELSAPDPEDDGRPCIVRTRDGFHVTHWQFDPRKLRDAERQRRLRARGGA